MLKVVLLYCINECIVYGLVLSLLIVVSRSLSAVIRSNVILVPMVKTAWLLGKCLYGLYQTSNEINDSLTFTTNLKYPLICITYNSVKKLMFLLSFGDHAKDGFDVLYTDGSKWRATVQLGQTVLQYEIEIDRVMFESILQLLWYRHLLVYRPIHVLGLGKLFVKKSVLSRVKMIGRWPPNVWQSSNPEKKFIDPMSL